MGRGWDQREPDVQRSRGKAEQPVRARACCPVSLGRGRQAGGGGVRRVGQQGL